MDKKKCEIQIKVKPHWKYKLNMYGLYLTTVNLRISITKINIKYYESFYVETILCVQVGF